MNTAHLIAQLLNIEQAVGTLEPTRIRGLLFEAEESVLQIEQQMIELLLENDRLRERLEASRRSASTLTEPRTTEKILVN
jgi:regulator of replication initiation timing